MLLPGQRLYHRIQNRIRPKDDRDAYDGIEHGFTAFGDPLLAPARGEPHDAAGDKYQKSKGPQNSERFLDHLTQNNPQVSTLRALTERILEFDGRG